MAYLDLTPLVGRDVDTAVMRAAGDLVRARVLPSRTEIVLPVLYPGGSHVAVFVYQDGDGFTVTDEGGGANEAEMAGVSAKAYAKAARDGAKLVGATCDSRAFFFLRVRADRLAAAITILADLSRATVAKCLDALAEKASAGLEDELMEHLGQAFGPSHVDRGAEIAGASNVTHKVAARVSFNGRQVVFDLFTHQGNSFNAAVSKFLDISHRQDSPARVGVTPVRARLGDRLALVSSVARVIDLGAAAETYRRSAA